MKKLLIFMMTILLLTGCSSTTKEFTYMITHDDILYALYNQDGERLTDYLYTSYKEVDGIGYIVTDDKEQVGLISLEGKEIIKPGVYASLESTDQMFYATKKVEEKKKDNNETDTKKDENQELVIKTILYVLNSQGDVLYTNDENTKIIKSGLPIIQKDKEYIVLHHQGDEFYHDATEVKYAYSYNDNVIIGFKDYAELTHLKSQDSEKDIQLRVKSNGTYCIIAESENGLVLNDKENKSMIYVDLSNQQSYQYGIEVEEASFDVNKNVILKNEEKTYVYQVGQKPILMNTYYLNATTYLVRSSDVYGPHTIYKDAKKVAELENCQLYPAAQKINSEIFPVFVKDDGYQYYNFEGKKVIENSFKEALPFDESETAIVKMSENGYSLIDKNGRVLTEKEYYDMKYIGSSYYAVYNDIGAFGIIDKSGHEVLAMEYTSMPDDVIAYHEDDKYMLLMKNGRSYVYDINNEMKEIFSQEGSVKYYEEGYLRIGNQYFTLEGEMIE